MTTPPFPTRHGRTSITITALCFAAALLTCFSGGGFLDWFGLFLFVGPAAVIGQIVAVVYAVKALNAKNDEKTLAMVTIVMAAVLLIGCIAVFTVAVGGVNTFYQ